ncbi:hypothetical protein MMC28_002296 [Mycoblastus sanguinarius]|nr:hypothetical protein [Mycoblastus sanguinarius]
MVKHSKTNVAATVQLEVSSDDDGQCLVTTKEDFIRRQPKQARRQEEQRGHTHDCLMEKISKTLLLEAASLTISPNICQDSPTVTLGLPAAWIRTWSNPKRTDMVPVDAWKRRYVASETPNMSQMKLRWNPK